MSDVKVKIKVTGRLVNAYYDNDKEKYVCGISLGSDTALKIEDLMVSAGFEWSGTSSPIKETEEGNPYLKVSTLYTPQVRGLPTGFTYTELGKGSTVTASCVLKEGRYNRAKYVSAYLAAVDIKDFVPCESYDAFEDEEFQNMEEECPFTDGCAK